MGKKSLCGPDPPLRRRRFPAGPTLTSPTSTNAHTMAKGGVLTSKITCTMHTGTHCDAPRHVMEYEFDGRRARYTHEMPIDAYTGDAVVPAHRRGALAPDHRQAPGCGLRQDRHEARAAQGHGGLPEHRYAPPV